MPSSPTDPGAAATGTASGTAPQRHGDGRPRRSTLWINLALALASTVVLFLVIEGFSSVLMSIRAAKHTLLTREESHSQYDADLGWRHQPDVRIDDLYGGKTSFSTNARGFRSRENFDQAVPPGRYRLVALGDSFTLGLGVGDDATFPARMQASCSVLQTVNMGQSGYGVDQDYLWYKRDGAQLDANVLLFAVVAQDFFRMTNDNFIGYRKPVLRTRDRALVIENVPVPATWNIQPQLRRVRDFLESLAVVKLGHWVAWHVAGPPADRFYGVVGDEVLAAAGLAFDDLAALSRARGQAFVLVYLPTRDLLAQEPTREAQWMQGYARKNGVPFIDLVPAFTQLAPAEIERMYLPDDHYTDAGNRFVAEKLLVQLAGMVPGFPSCAPRAVP